MAPSGWILVLEDDADFFEVLMMSLELEIDMKGVRLVWAKDSSVAVEVLESTKVDLVITDYHQPRGNAEPLLRSIAEGKGKGRIPFTQVVCMSGNDRPVGGFAEAVKSGAVFLRKTDPEFARKIAARVRKCLKPTVSQQAA